MRFNSYSIEKLYADYGRYDATVSIVLRPDSPSFLAFGKHLTGILYYTRMERNELETKITTHRTEWEETFGKVKIAILLKNDLSDEKIKTLNFEGFNSEDILYLDYLISEKTPPYLDEGTRTLPSPFPIYVRISSMIEEYKVAYGFYKNRFDKNENLAKFEYNKLAALSLFFEQQSINKDFKSQYVLNSRGDIKNEVLYEYLKIKYYTDTLDGKEQQDYERIFKTRLKSVYKSVEQEFLNTGITKKEIYSIHLPLFYQIVINACQFEPYVIQFSKIPIFLDLNGILHIYFRHTKELRIGKNYQEKSVLQYSFNQCEDLIKICLENMRDEINIHFTKFPNKRFSKFGNQEIYYNGDYYRLHIAPSGRIETFFKSNR